MAALLRWSAKPSSVSRYVCKTAWLKPVSVAFCVHSHLQHSIACVQDGSLSKFENVQLQVQQINPKLFQSSNGALRTSSEKQRHLTSENVDSFPRYTFPKLCSTPHLMHRPNKSLLLTSKQNNTLLLNSLSQDPLIDRTQLAIMTLDYNEEWLKNFQPIYEKALTTHSALLKPKRKTLLMKGEGQDLGHSKTECQEEESVIDSDRWLNYGTRAGNQTLWFASNLCNEVNKPAPKSSTPDKCDPMQLATVFLALRDELPLFFQKGHGYSLYHNKVKFINGLTGVTSSGLTAYKSMLTTMRLAAQVCLSEASIDILKITENPKESNVKVRWRVTGVPRYSNIMSKGRPWDNKLRYVDGFSIFEVGPDGLIHCHRLQKLMPSKSTETDNPLWALNPSAVIGLLNQTPEMLARQRVEDVDGTFSAVLQS